MIYPSEEHYSDELPPDVQDTKSQKFERFDSNCHGAKVSSRQNKLRRTHPILLTAALLLSCLFAYIAGSGLPQVQNARDTLVDLVQHQIQTRESTACYPDGSMKRLAALFGIIVSPGNREMRDMLRWAYSQWQPYLNPTDVAKIVFVVCRSQNETTQASVEAEYLKYGDILFVEGQDAEPVNGVRADAHAADTGKTFNFFNVSSQSQLSMLLLNLERAPQFLGCYIHGQSRRLRRSVQERYRCLYQPPEGLQGFTRAQRQSSAILLGWPVRGL